MKYTKLFSSPSLYCGGIFDYDNACEQLRTFNLKVEQPDLWDHPESAQLLLKQRDQLHQAITRIDTFAQDVQDTRDMLELALAEDDTTLAEELESALVTLHQQAARMQLETLLSGEADGFDCFMEINAGAGGTEAQDWAEMLSRMYMRWAEKRKFKMTLLDENPGEEAGIKSITVQISGHQAYGWLKAESGVHRLVRISPYDANARRHTSFASVWVYPVIDSTIHVTIEEKDLRIDTYRASGAGGQHVNKTESAIRITHLPTGIVVQCQNDRSQHRNRAQAYDMLKARLYERELRAREEKHNDQASSKTDIGWGHQIRSYVLQPYQLVKDTRTSVEKGNAHGVLDGDIDEFLEAALAHKVADA